MNKREESSVKIGLAEMLKGGVVMDVTNVEQAMIAEQAGAAAVMALERIPSDIRKEGGYSRMSDPKMIADIEGGLVPVMAKCRIGHFVEARILEELDRLHRRKRSAHPGRRGIPHRDAYDFKAPFVCGCRNLGEALRRIGEGAAMIRTKGEAGTGDIVEAVRHMRRLMADIRRISNMDEAELMTAAKELQAPYELLLETRRLGKLPVPNFAAGGVATPADAALMMHLGAESVFVGSGIFKSKDPEQRARAIVAAVAHYKDPAVLLQVSTGLGPAMDGIPVSGMAESEKIAGRGW